MGAEHTGQTWVRRAAPAPTRAIRLWSRGALGSLAVSALLLVVLMPDVVRAQAAEIGAFVLLIGRDTLAVENFTRGLGRLEGELTGAEIGRVAYQAALGSAGLVSELSVQAWPPGAASGSPPVQNARLAFRGGQVEITSGSASGAPAQIIPTQPGAVPHLNPSFALIEQLIARAAMTGGLEPGGPPVEVPVFLAQGGQTLPATVRQTAPDSVVIVLAGLEMRGRVGPDRRLLGAAVPVQNLTVSRVQGVHLAPISQAPPDYSPPAGAPYTAEEVRVPTPAGHTLAGTLTRPVISALAPAVVLITGSGPQSRDQVIATVSGYKPFREIADTLGRRGIAVLRLDDRGYGESSGDFASATSADFATDVAAALAFLRTRPDIDARRLGVIGHSEGGLIGPMVAAADSSLAALVVIAGPAETGRESLDFQQQYSVEHVQQLPPAQRDEALAVARAQLQAEVARSPWLAFFWEYDPLVVARQVRRTPVLILHGETDRQVPVGQATTLAAAFRAAGNGDVTVRTFPGVNHLLLHDPDGNPARYSDLPDRGVAREVLGSLADWLATRL